MGKSKSILTLPLPVNLVPPANNQQVFPVISGLCWLGMLLGLLISWATTTVRLPTGELQSPPRYITMDRGQTIAYISDVGAQHLKPLFIAGSIVTTVFLDLAFLSERWLRHRGRLARNTTSLEKTLSYLGILFAVFGSAGLILLSIFDTLHYPTAHDCFLLLFIAGYVVSAVFICWEYQRLGIRMAPSFLLNLLILNLPLLTEPRFPRTPHPPLLLLDKTNLHPPRSLPRNRLRIV